MIKEISSKENRIYKDALKLKETKYRKTCQEFLLEGKKAINEALKAKLLVKVFVLKEDNSLPYDIEQFIIPFDMLKRMSFTPNPEGIIGVVKYPTFDKKEEHKCVYLDNIQDPGNMGTIIRSAVALGYDAIYVSSDCVDVYNEKCIASCKGAIFSIPVKTAKFSDILSGKELIATCLTSESKPLKVEKINKDFMLVFGNEAHGIRNEIIEKCNKKVVIPMNGFDSLNVSVAAGIVMWAYCDNH